MVRSADHVAETQLHVLADLVRCRSLRVRLVYHVGQLELTKMMPDAHLQPRDHMAHRNLLHHSRGAIIPTEWSGRSDGSRYDPGICSPNPFSAGELPFDHIEVVAIPYTYSAGLKQVKMMQKHGF